MAITKKEIIVKIALPQGANVFAEKGDPLHELLLYEVDQLEVLEDVKVNTKVSYQVKDGQFINKGDVIFTEGFMGSKLMVADFAGIIEISENRCRILGQKYRVERRLNLDGEVLSVIPDKHIRVKVNVIQVTPPLISNQTKKFSRLVYLESKNEIKADLLKLGNLDSTFFINDNLYVEDIAKAIAFGAKRIIVNGLYIHDLRFYQKEIAKLDSFAVIAGFGEFPSRAIKIDSPDYDVYWTRDSICFAGSIRQVPLVAYEHPFWGLTGDFHKKNDLVGELDYNGEIFEFYLKNIENNV